jgi:hypothetical protein
MCDHKECKYIEIIQIDDNGTKVYIHYNAKMRPIYIQYWSAKAGDLDFIPNPSKNNLTS